MVNMPANAPVTRREFHMELMIVWLFILLVSNAAIDDRSRWSALLIPVFALIMVALHAFALRRAFATPPTAGKGVV